MRLKNKILLFLSVMGPGIITANIDNDASGITVYSVAGARFGYSLIWTLIPTTIVLVIVQEMASRMGVVTGKGLSDLIRERFGIRITFFMMIGLLIANFVNTMANLAGLAASIEILGVSKYFIVPIGTMTIWLLVTKGSYKTVEKILLGACVMYVGYIVSGFMANHQWGVVAKSIVVPQIIYSTEYLMLGIAIIGTTVTPWMQFYLQSSIAEKGIKIEHYKAARLDVVVGCSITDIVSFFIILTCATLLFPLGIQINEASEAALALKPISDNYSYLIFAVCLANASLLGAIIIPLASAYYICESMGWEAGVNKSFQEAPQFMWIYTITILIASLLVLIPNISLVSLMIFSAVINGLLLPSVIICMLILINDKRIMGNYINSKTYNYISWVIAFIIILFSMILIALFLI